MRIFLWRWTLVLCLLVCLPVKVSGAGQPFIITDHGALDLAYIRDGELVTNFNYPNDKGIIARYTGVDLGETVTEARCIARFMGGGTVAIVVKPVGSWSLFGITSRSIHAVFASDGYYLGFYEDGMLTDVLTGAYELDTTGETEYTFGLAIRKDVITLTLPDGKTAKKRDARVQGCGGPQVVFEHFLSAEDVAQKAAPVITGIYAKGASLPALEDDFERPDGLPVTAPTGHAYMLFRNLDAPAEGMD